MHELVIFFGSLTALSILEAIRRAARQLVSDVHSLKTEIEQLNMNLQEIRDRVAPTRADYRG